MPQLPMNFVTRMELQDMILRLGRVQVQIRDNSLSPLVQALLSALAGVEGWMSELADSKPSHHPAHAALDNPHGWTQEWVESKFSMETARGSFSVGLAQQILRTANRGLFVTGRFRLRLGTDQHVSTDCEMLSSLLERYVLSFEDSLPPEVRAFTDGLLGQG